MPIIKRRVTGPLQVRRPIKLPPANPGSAQILLTALRRRLAGGPVGRFIRDAVHRHPYITGAHGPECVIDRTANIADAILNATSGRIVIGPYVGFGHGVSLLAGTHDVSKRGLDRQLAIPAAGFDITIEEGVWVATNAVIIGPARVGQHTVVAAGAVVIGDVPPNVIVGGIPARVIRHLDDDSSELLSSSDPADA